MYRTELKNLAAQTYVKWQGLLPQTWLQQTPQQVPSLGRGFGTPAGPSVQTHGQAATGGMPRGAVAGSRARAGPV